MLRNVVRLSVALFAACVLALIGRGAEPAYADHGLPHAHVRVWPVTEQIGLNPTESAEDANGVTGHVATPSDKVTVVTIMKNMLTAPTFELNGLIFWNPVTNDFKWYGVVDAGSTSGLDINRGAPLRDAPTGQLFTAPVLQPGDVWASVQGGTDVENTSLYVNFKGTDNFRKYQLIGPGAIGILSGVNGIVVHQQTGDVFFTEENLGTINRLNPATNVVTSWSVGGTPHYLAIGPTDGRVYATVANTTLTGTPSDAIVRLDPTTSSVTAWPVPGGLMNFTPGPVSSLADLDIPDGLDIDAQGNVWFVETQSNQVGRLDPSANTITEFTKDGMARPQQIGVRSQGGSVKAYFTEGEGEAVSALTPNSPASPAPPVTQPVTPLTLTVLTFDVVKASRRMTIPPADFDIPGVNGGTGEIIRFTPMPAPAGGNDAEQRHPSGITDVVSNDWVLGNYLDPMMAANSAVFRVIEQMVKGPSNPPPPSPTGTLKVTGGGTIPVGTKKANFGFNAQKEPNGTPRGQLQFTDHSNGDKVHSETIDNLVISGNTATFEGTARRNNVPCGRFKVTVQDNGSPGSADTFKIEGTCANRGPLTLSGGNIVIHD
jgi:hypothetical protein